METRYVSNAAIEPSSLLRALSRSVLLETLLFPLIMSYDVIFQVPQRLLTLPNLRRLLISPFHPTNNVLRSIRAQSLETLEINYQISILTLKTFLRESVPEKLTTLAINHLRLRGQDVAHMRSSRSEERRVGKECRN